MKYSEGPEEDIFFSFILAFLPNNWLVLCTFLLLVVYFLLSLCQFRRSTSTSHLCSSLTECTICQGMNLFISYIPGTILLSCFYFPKVSLKGLNILSCRLVCLYKQSKGTWEQSDIQITIGPLLMLSLIVNVISWLNSL